VTGLTWNFACFGGKAPYDARLEWKRDNRNQAERGRVMSAADQLGLDDIEVDVGSLYREEVITDRKVAQLRRLVPIQADGTDDGERKVLYTGSTSIMLPTGPLPISCEIEADSLKQACEKFPEAIQVAVEEMINRVHEYQREEAKRIVTPNELASGKGGGLII
jgi:hypothetical protein